MSPSTHLLKVSRLVENMISVAPDAFTAEHGRPSKTDPDLTLVYALMLIVGHGRTDHKFAHLEEVKLALGLRRTDVSFQRESRLTCNSVSVIVDRLTRA